MLYLKNEQGGGEMKWSRKQVGWSAFLVILVLGMTLLGNWATFFGTPERYLEADARKSQYIDADWQSVSAVNDRAAGLLFYDETQTEFIYSVYTKQPGLPLGYVFRRGGSDGVIARGVNSFNGVLLSMNQPQVAQIVLNEGEDNETLIAIDPSQPFAYAVPQGTESFVLYDQQGESVPITTTVLIF